MTVELVYETHSITEDNEAGIATGWLPGRLSDRGRRLAVELGDRRRDEDIAAVYTSDLARAVDTAQIAFGASQVPMHLDARLRECDYGTLNGSPVGDLDWVRLAHVEDPFPGGQGYRDVVEATAGFLRDLRRDHEGRRVLVIAHSANRWALDHLLNGAPIEELVDAPFDWQPGWLYVVNASSSASDIE